MTTASSHPNPGAFDGNAEPLAPVRGTVRRLLGWIIPANAAIYLIWGAIPTVLLPTQVENIDPVHKVANLAIITTVGAFSAMVAQPIAGRLSDRTRSRFGRRAPWMIAGALIGGLGLIGMAAANGLVQVGIAWCIVQIAYNFAQGPLSAIMPDRIPTAVRGTFSSLSGLGLLMGALGGQIVGAELVRNLPAAYLLIAGFALVALVLFVVFNPDHSSKDLVRGSFSVRDFLATFWVNPVAHPDFFFAFAGRLLLYTGYFAIIGYQLYILQDYVGLGDRSAGYIPLLGIASFAGILPATIISGPLSDRLGRRKIFVFIASLLIGIALIFPWVLPTLTGMFFFAVISGIGFGCFQAVDTAIMSQVLPSAKSFAKDLGVINIAATLPQTLAPAVAGGVVLAFGYAGLYPIGMILSVLGAISIWPIKAVR
jgi:MFS family permease